MNEFRQARILSERKGKWMLNLYPPILFNRITVRKIGRDYRSMTVRVARSLITRNMNGTTFGGTIFSAADPFYSVMYWQILARENIRIRIWLKSATIRYLKPAASELTLEFSLSENRIREATETLTRDGKFVGSHHTEAVDTDGVVCALIETEVHIRLAGDEQRPVSSF